jgi:DNA-directed RNA polymerase subunit RPC12/RpoP
MKLKCVCGKIFANVPDSMIGQKLRCKDCGKVLTVKPAASSDEGAKENDGTDVLTVKGHRRCPACGKSWPVRDKICTACGVDMETGAALYVSLEEPGTNKAANGKASERPSFLKRIFGLFGKKGG